MTELAQRYRLPRSLVVDRDAFILECCHGKRVLHLGCANWPFTKELFDDGLLLHQEIEMVCAELVGIDISEKGINFLKSRGVKNLLVADAAKLGEVIQRLEWTPEIVIAGEIIEHLDTPGTLLREFSHHMPPRCTLLITVPNALSIKGILHVMLGHEKVHSDHVAYYSYATMLNLLSRCGFDIIDVRCYRHPSTNALEWAFHLFLSMLLFLRPHLSPGLIFRCHKLQM